MKYLKITKIVLSILVIYTPFIALAEGEENVIVSPLTLISYGQIAACGVKIKTGSLYEKISTEVKVEHKGGKNIFSIRAGYDDREKNKTLAELSLKTLSVETRNSFSKASFDDEGFLFTSAALDDGTGAKFIQELLVTGGEFSIRKKDGNIISFSIPRPVSHSIRQAYLSCAGDLIGPGPE